MDDSWIKWLFFVVAAESGHLILTLTYSTEISGHNSWSFWLDVTKMQFLHERLGVVKSICDTKKRPILAVMLAANMASKVCIKYTTLWMPNAAQEENFLTYQRKKKFTNCATTVESSWIVCAPLTKEAAKRLKHCNNASKLRNRRFKVTIEYSFSRLVALIRPIQNSIAD